MALPVIPRLCPTPFQLCLGLGVSELEGVFFAIIGELMQNVGVDFGRRCEFSCVIVVCSFTLMPAPLGFKIGNICITWDASLGEPLHCLCVSVTSQNRMRVLEMVRSRHGMITGFKLYRGLESHGFKSTKMFRYTVSAVCTGFYVSSKTESAVKSARVTWQSVSVRVTRVYNDSRRR